MKIDAKEFVDAVRRIASENPDKVYEETDEGCVYVEEDPDTGELVGSCLIGCALISIGIPAEDLDLDETEIFYNLIGRLGLELPPGVAEWANFVQRRQDSGQPWGESVRDADKEHPLEDN